MRDLNLHEYYSRRAPEYELVYQRDDPVRQGELAALAAAIGEVLRGRRVLEIACGTGFWTEVAAEVAQHVVATDISPDMLAVAEARGLPPHKVEFRRADAYALEAIPGTFDAGLANFWFSHVPKARVDGFLHGLHERLGPGSILFMADNVYVPGIGGELLARPETEDTFKLRTLSNGSKHEVLKNYYDADRLRRILAPRAADLQVHVGRCFWWLSYTIPI